METTLRLFQIFSTWKIKFIVKFQYVDSSVSQRTKQKQTKKMEYFAALMTTFVYGRLFDTTTMCM